MNEISRELFEAWMFSQPKEREFNYLSTRECALCQFFKETTNLAALVGATDFNLYKDQVFGPEVAYGLIPDWISQLLSTRWFMAPQDGSLTIAKMQARYLELFPQTETEIAPAEASKAPALMA